jgi:uncharacterized protein with von Willebrand factor type A (vWA) domain
VTPERSGRFARAVTLAQPITLDELYWCARVTLLSGPEQLAAFDAVYMSIFAGVVDPAEHRGDPNDATVARPEPSHADPERAAAAAGGGGDRAAATVPPDREGGMSEVEEVAVPAMASGEERLASKDFADLTADELSALRGLMAGLVVSLPPRVARRTRRHPAGDRMDLRATVRRSHRSGGDPVVRIHRRRRVRSRRLVVLLDISGSMEAYARAYLQLLHGASNAVRAETFTFATRLTRLTRALRVSSPTMALHRAGVAAPDWSGGTRIADGVKAFLDDHGRRGMARGAVVVIVSDGWERGDPAALGVQMERLARLAHRIVWVNPRQAAEGYQPLVGGMAAALPHCDVVLSGHSAVALEQVVAALG